MQLLFSNLIPVTAIVPSCRNMLTILSVEDYAVNINLVFPPSGQTNVNSRTTEVRRSFP